MRSQLPRRQVLSHLFNTHPGDLDGFPDATHEDYRNFVLGLALAALGLLIPTSGVYLGFTGHGWRYFTVGIIAVPFSAAVAPRFLGQGLAVLRDANRAQRIMVAVICGGLLFTMAAFLMGSGVSEHHIDGARNSASKRKAINARFRQELRELFGSDYDD